LTPPKRNPTAPETEWLWVLSELDNIDKHRTILVVDPRLMTKRRTPDGKVSVVKQPLAPDTQAFAVPLPAPTSLGEVDMAERAVVVVLAETGLRCDNITAIKVWRELVGSVKAVIDKLSDFSSGSSHTYLVSRPRETKEPHLWVSPVMGGVFVVS
jgi:hypothetical protein